MDSLMVRSGYVGRVLRFSVILGLLLGCLPVFSQVNQGRIGGTISDQSGGIIVGATVTVTDVERGTARALVTDSAGLYSAPNLTPGTYIVRAEFMGFKTVDRRDILVQVGQDVRVDISLEPGEQNQTVTVTGEPPEVNTTNAQLGGTISNQAAVDLPLAGGDFIYLMSYRPGLMTRPGGGGGNVNYSNGMRPTFNVYVIDGLPDFQVWSGGTVANGSFIGAGPDESNILPVDAVQEFDLVENPKAEYGWRPGAQVNVGLKSGTNTIHGTAFAFGRDTALDTANPFIQKKAPTNFEQFGATIGGPIKKEKVFYFAGYEGQRYDVGNPKTIVFPTTAAGAGPSNSIPDAVAGLIAAGVTPSQLSLNLAGCTRMGATATCNSAAGLFGNSGPTSNWATDFPDIGGSDNGVVKVDYHINDRNSFNGDFFVGEGNVLGEVQNTTASWWETPLTSHGDVARGVWVWTPNSTSLNEVRFGWDRLWANADVSPDCSAGSGAPNYAAMGFVSGAPVCGFPTITISGFNPNPTGQSQTQSLGDPEGIDLHQNIYSISDNFSYTHGKHQFKFGVEGVYQTLHAITTISPAKGTLSFSTSVNAFAGATPLENFMAGVVASGTLELGNPVRNVSFKQFAGYAQDDWRISQRVTLNLGLRYEYTGALHEANNLLGSFDPAAPTGLIQASSSNGNAVYRGYPWNFAPRLGVAWDVTGKGTTVMHGGFNIAYWYPFANEFLSTGGNEELVPTGLPLKNGGSTVTTPGGTINLTTLSITPPSSPIPWAVNTPVFGNYASASPSCSNTVPCSIGGTEPHLGSTMVFLWNFGIQRAITNSMTLDVSYVGNHGEHEFDFVDVNQPIPGAKGTTAEQARRPYTLDGEFPYFSKILMNGTWARSNYDGLQATLTQRVNHNLTFTFGYTYSHALDDTSVDNTEIIPQNSNNRYGEYGNASQDYRNRFTLAATYQLPGKKGYGQMLEGWQITSGVIRLSAIPWNAVDTGDDFSGTGEGQDRWTLYGNAKDFDGFGGGSPIPCFGLTTSKTFNAASGCTILGSSVSALPQACQTAAANEQSGTNTGLQQLASVGGCYAVGSSAMVAPAQGTFGTMSRFELRGKGFSSWDMSITKNWVFRERLTTQFRAEFFNLLNMTQYSSPSSNPATPASFGESPGTPNIVNGSPITGSGDSRRIQFMLRFQF